MFSLEILQFYWWFIVSLLGGLLVFMMFVQGGQTLIFSLAKNELQKDMIINSIGRKWELTFTTLVMFGGACFAAFPLFYATSFGGAYWVWLAILFCFILQAVSYEYRKKPDNFLGVKTYEIFLYINGSLGVILIGMAVSTFFSGSDFMLNERNFVDWQTPWRGLEALANPMLYLLGLAMFFLSRIGGALYLINNINDEELRANARKAVLKNTILFLPFFLAFLFWILTKDGFEYDANGVVTLSKYKYSLNLVKMPMIALAMTVGIVTVLYSVFKGAFTKSIHAIFPYGLGVVLVVTSLFLITGLNNTAFYPSFSNLQSSLTIKNASSSHYTLNVMAYVSLLVPVVLGYIFVVWRAIDSKKITKEEIKNDQHAY
ncbi:cytochrome d ubiquinol oxidase subunit II [Campylobacter sp. RM9344]|uniref:Cytochrome d ubiquinol oxidase subunit II n=1 Tax=Campylobacter californiensis TaxID=1032243 RepID=A0AAW3ZWG4_9BACT|nr:MULTISPECIES: cytochrome d ubiquinol oxidase subunit II [unclassified Campylobacter]MBE2985029.1 cytochrome d ubiquinol oxidase subunit II [Campylobacter sp. RM6883]MBE2986741.1 cytochrome d ubiquinol oxidase subunit II [Campylobacter sp. RM12919]MBE2988465.1 cytochrome d ubiquinol oxidase subunit II [Campylobacter sp. RM12920]MBE2995225.1 cytochrome d ubiquinol oxidase subunit II [Campylobacter sp. RM6913]MBE3029518.1 cytochrome d ubiquinol oxidase subunit II [Campylobacter sp. RM9344]